MTHEAIASAVGRSRSSVTNLLRLLDLEIEVSELLESGKLEMGHARALLALKNQDQVQAARHVCQAGLNVRATEAYVKKFGKAGKKTNKAAGRDPNIARLEQELSESLGATVTVRDKRGKGSLEIRYHSLDELQGIIDKIKK